MRNTRIDFTTPFKIYSSTDELLGEGITDHGPTADQMLSKLNEMTRQVDVPKNVKAAMEQVAKMDKEKYPKAMPVVKMNLKYKPMESITKAPHFVKFIPPVYSDALNFDYADKDYEIREKDRKFLSILNEKLGKQASTNPNQVSFVSEHDFERCIDAFEKIYRETKKKQDTVMLENFFKLADPQL